MEDTKIERQKFQMHQKGYSTIVEAIKGIQIPEVVIPETKMNMCETNDILKALVDKMGEPINITITLE